MKAVWQFPCSMSIAMTGTSCGPVWQIGCAASATGWKFRYPWTIFGC